MYVESGSNVETNMVSFCFSGAIMDGPVDTFFSAEVQSRSSACQSSMPDPHRGTGEICHRAREPWPIDEPAPLDNGKL